MKQTDHVMLGHGSGGSLSHRLISELFLRYFKDGELGKLNDAACLEFPGERLVFSTDSYVVDPVFFPGGDIGRLAVSGTVNDVAVMGGIPLYLSCGFILEEGFPLKDLEVILRSMAGTADEAGVRLVTGDTKVVPKGAADKVFINTAGIGVAKSGISLSGHNAREGDKVIINGEIGDHGVTVMARREGLNLDLDIKSDAAPLNLMIHDLLDRIPDIHVLRDPTRGGLGTSLNEIASQSGVGIRLSEDSLPVSAAVNSVCEILGLDPLYIANEGKVIIITPAEYADKAVRIMKNHVYGGKACVIGEVVAEPKGKVILETGIGGSRLIDMLAGEQLPRIC